MPRNPSERQRECVVGNRATLSSSHLVLKEFEEALVRYQRTKPLGVTLTRGVDRGSFTCDEG